MKSTLSTETQGASARNVRGAEKKQPPHPMSPTNAEKPAKPKRSASKRLKDSIASAIESITSPLKSRAAKSKIAEAKSQTAPASHPRRIIQHKKKIAVPQILLEGDETPLPPDSGPGKKFELGPEPVGQKSAGAEGELPEAYGTKRLFLTARDPHWLYANWDLTHEQQARLNARSGDGHLVLRIYTNVIEGHPIYEIHVHPESRHWFTHVEHAGNSYAAELGYYSPVGRWMRVAVSAATLTPPDAVAEEDDVEFATIPSEFPFARLMEIVKAAVHENVPLSQAIEELRRSGHAQLPRIANKATPWTPQQEQALEKIVTVDQMRRVWMGSMEITELIRRRLAQEVSSLGISSLGVSSLSSPFGGGGKQKGFWFNVNAELIIYGATEPDAKVSLGGREIKLRPDGTFSYRFSLPDGKYELPAVAVSADGTDARAAELKFSRETEYRGEVGAHPQDPTLQPPLAENF